MINFFLSFLSAVEVDMKTNFDSGETLMVKISGNFVNPITPENIFFYRGHIRVPFLYDVTEIEDEFYIYAILSETPGNYSMVIKDTKYMQGSQISEQEIQKNFSILEKKAEFNINPGFIVTKEDFSIKTQNLQDNKISVKINSENKTTDTLGFFESLFGKKDAVEENSEDIIELKSGEIRKIDFNIDEPEESSYGFIKLSSGNLTYNIPVYILSNKTKQQGRKEFRFSPLELNITLSLNENKSKIIYLYNIGQQDIEYIEINVSDSLKNHLTISRQEIEDLEQGKDYRIDVFVKPFNKEKNIQGELTASAEDYIASLPIILNFVKSSTIIDDKEDYDTFNSCDELSGIICEKNQECSGKVQDSTEGNCCIGECVEVQKSSTGKVIGWLIIILTLLFLIWFFGKRFFASKRKKINF